MKNAFLLTVMAAFCTESAFGSPVEEISKDNSRFLADDGALPSEGYCQFWAMGKYFDISALEKTTEYNDEDKQVYWNYCKYATKPQNTEWPDDVYPDVTYLPMTAFFNRYSGPMPYTDDNPTVATKWATYNEEPSSVTFSIYSSTQCPGNPLKLTSMTTKVICNNDITNSGAAVLKSTDYLTDPCDLSIVLEHQAGCGSRSSEMDMTGLQTFLQSSTGWDWATIAVSGGKWAFVMIIIVGLRFLLNLY